MEKTDIILMQSGISPTLVSRENKEWLNTAYAQPIQENIASASTIFQEAVTRLSDWHSATASLCQELTEVTDEATAVIESLFELTPKNALLFRSSYTEKQLTARHVALLKKWQPLKDRAAILSSRVPMPLESLREELMLTLLYAILREKKASADCLADLQHKRATLSDAQKILNRSRKDQASLTVGLHRLLGDFSKNSSLLLTEINREEKTQTEYFRYLRSSLIQLHDYSQTAKRLQKEAAHVQISDVL